MCYVTSVTTVPVLAANGAEAAKISSERVRRLLKKQDTAVYIPGVTALRGSVSREVVEDILRGHLGKEEPTRGQGEMRMAGEGEIEQSAVCRNCGHKEVGHTRRQPEKEDWCQGRGGVPCACIVFEACLNEEEEASWGRTE